MSLSPCQQNYRPDRNQLAELTSSCCHCARTGRVSGTTPTSDIGLDPVGRIESVAHTGPEETQLYRLSLPFSFYNVAMGVGGHRIPSTFAHSIRP